MARYENLSFTYSDPGTGANTAQKFSGGPAVFIFDASAMATTTTIKAQISLDNSAFVDLNDITGAAVTVTSATATDAYFNVELPACWFRTNITAAGGATTTATANLVAMKSDSDG